MRVLEAMALLAVEALALLLLMAAYLRASRQRKLAQTQCDG